jgi:hypothetical protein
MKLPRLGVPLLLVLALAMLVQTSCGGPTFVVQQYGGPKRDAATIAVVRFAGNDEARLVVIDGERADVNIEEDARLHVEVLPGEHTVGVVSAARLDEPLRMVSFRAEPGKVYRIALADSQARAYEVASGSDARLRDVTIDKPASREPPTHWAPPPTATEPQPSDLPEPEPAQPDGGSSAPEQAEP